MELSGAEIITEVFKEQLTDTVFGYPGSAVLDIYDALYRNGGSMRHILTSHEQGAAHSADGYARASGKTGVVVATSGPGATNLITGIAAAYMDSSPVVAVTGNVGTSHLGTDGFQEVDIAGIAMPVTKHSVIASDVRTLASDLREAFVVAASGRPGPVIVDVPSDILSARTEYTPEPKQALRENPPADPAGVADAVRALEASRRPLMLVGGGVNTQEAASTVSRFAEQYDIPAVCTLRGLGAVSAYDPMYFGMVGKFGSASANTALASCDLLIAVGTRLAERAVGVNYSLPDGAKLIHIDIDAAEIGKNVPAAVGLNCDVCAAIEAIETALEPMEHSDWVADLAVKFIDADKRKPCAPERIIRNIANLTTGETQIVTDVGQHQLWTAQYYPFRRVRSFISSAGLGAMGFGLGAAIGASLACPERQTALITGDGSFHMDMNELATVAKYSLPIKIFVINNGVLGLVHQWQRADYGGRFSQTEPHRGTDIAMIAKAFGIPSFTVKRDRQITKRIIDAFDEKGAALVDCRISPDEEVGVM